MMVLYCELLNNVSQVNLEIHWKAVLSAEGFLFPLDTVMHQLDPSFLGTASS